MQRDRSAPPSRGLGRAHQGDDDAPRRPPTGCRRCPSAEGPPPAGQGIGRPPRGREAVPGVAIFRAAARRRGGVVAPAPAWAGAGRASPHVAAGASGRGGSAPGRRMRGGRGGAAAAPSAGRRQVRAARGSPRAPPPARGRGPVPVRGR